MSKPESENMIPVGFRMPEGTLDRIDAFAKSQHLRKRSDAVRVLIERGLRDAGFPMPSPVKKAKPKKRK